MSLSYRNLPARLFYRFILWPAETLLLAVVLGFIALLNIRGASFIFGSLFALIGPLTPFKPNISLYVLTLNLGLISLDVYPVATQSVILYKLEVVILLSQPVYTSLVRISFPTSLFRKVLSSRLASLSFINIVCLGLMFIPYISYLFKLISGTELP